MRKVSLWSEYSCPRYHAYEQSLLPKRLKLWTGKAERNDKTIGLANAWSSFVSCDATAARSTSHRAQHRELNRAEVDKQIQRRGR
jgi:hypothetical protein